jgi:hypothetical protein
MGLVDDLRIRGASSRVTEEALYAEALREVEASLRRDGLWSKALAETGMRQQDAQAYYLKLRVQSLRDEINLIVQDEACESHKKHQLLLEQSKAWRDRPIKGRSDWIDTLVGLTFVGAVIACLMFMFGK